MAKRIKGFEGLYRITSHGNVFANKRIVAMPNGGFKIIPPHRPKLSITKKGYLKVMLTNKNGVRKGHFVHRLVALHYLYNSDLQVNHIDLDKMNNDVSNLEFLTNRKNKIHSIDKTKTSSSYIGVTKSKSKRWQAQKMIKGIRTYLGTFDTEIQAHEAYLKAGI